MRTAVEAARCRARNAFLLSKIILVFEGHLFVYNDGNDRVFKTHYLSSNTNTASILLQESVQEFSGFLYTV